MEQVWIGIISGAMVGIITTVFGYFMRKQTKVDDIAEKYAAKADMDRMREKMDSFLSKDSCKAIRDDCVGKNWVEAVQRLEDIFTKKFDELNKLLYDIMKEMGSLQTKNKEF